MRKIFLIISLYFIGQVLSAPLTTHPRIWITPNDLPALRSKAVSSNPIYQQGMVPLLAKVVLTYNTNFFPNGVANPIYPDPGDTQGYTGLLSEEYGVILAFNSLIDPDPAKRIIYAQDARNLLMYAMNLAVLGHLPATPFRDAGFMVYNHANATGYDWPLIVDWIYNSIDASGNPILTPTDKATIRKVFMMWSNDCVNASTTGGDHPSPIGTVNSLTLLPGNKPYRMAVNNYYLAHARNMIMMGLSIDPSDDPSLDPTKPSSVLGNSLSSYLKDGFGAWLYQEYAMFGDPASVVKDLALPATVNPNVFGLASGGLPVEGQEYGHSMAFIAGELLALKTTGYDDPIISGPQIKLLHSSFAQKFFQGFLSSLLPNPGTYPNYVYLGPIYQFATYGDMLRVWMTPDFIRSFALFSLLEQEDGQSTDSQAAQWVSVYGLPGGKASLYSRIVNSFPDGVMNAIMYFMILDPTTLNPVDPRPSYPQTFVDVPQGRVVSHSGSSLFDYRGSWISVNHQSGDGGQFEFYRKGEWLTKEMSNYDYTYNGLTSYFHNTLTLQNSCVNDTPLTLHSYEIPTWENGSQFILGLNNGDPVTQESSGGSYINIYSDLTNLYNRPSARLGDAALSITQANRSLLYLEPDELFIYDRATSSISGLFKRFNLCLATNPVINGNTTTETLPDGQTLSIQTLLPQSASISAIDGTQSIKTHAQLDSMVYNLTVEDLTHPSDVRFFNVLQGTDSGASSVPVKLIQSKDGLFDGAISGTTVVYFPHNNLTPFNGISLPVPTGTTSLYVAGLPPSTLYNTSVGSDPSGGNDVSISSTSTVAFNYTTMISDTKKLSQDVNSSSPDLSVVTADINTLSNDLVSQSTPIMPSVTTDMLGLLHLVIQ